MFLYDKKTKNEILGKRYDINKFVYVPVIEYEVDEKNIVKL